jgi:hypothetical protein
LAVLDTRLTIHVDDEKQLTTKAGRLKNAISALGVAVDLAVLASILRYTGRGGGDE